VRGKPARLEGAGGAYVFAMTPASASQARALLAKGATA
jgi:hypothetical protein